MASPDDVWLVDFGDPYPQEPAHHRPAIVVGPSGIFGGMVPQVLVVPLTTRRRGLAVHVEVEPTAASGLVEISYAQCELVRSISDRRLVHRLGDIDAATADAVRCVVRALIEP